MDCSRSVCALGLVFVGGCALIAGLDNSYELEEQVDESTATEGANSVGGGMEASGTSGGSQGGEGGAGGTGGAGGAGGTGLNCPDPLLKGPMVTIQTIANITPYCVDATEVTREQYVLFLATSPELNQASPCDMNGSFTPTTAWPPKANQKNLPVVGVDYCDATAYCAWAGKRLCGAIGGGTTDLAGADNPTSSQWMNACSGGGMHKYPYGDAYEPQACNGLEYGLSTPIDVQNAIGCEGAAPGLFDLSGNVREWEDACNGDTCLVRGGSFKSDGSIGGELPCSGFATLNRFSTDDATGFRCCKDEE